MDTPQPEDVDLGFDPLDVVEHVLNAENLDFDRTEDGDLAFALAGDWKDYELWFAWRPEADCLQLCLSLDLRAPKRQRNHSYELLSLINQRVWLGHFDVWSNGSVLLYRHGLMLGDDGLLSLVQAQTAIEAAVDECDRFYPAFQFLLWGDKTPAEALASALIDAAGEA